MTEYLNKLISIEFSDRKKNETGILLDFSGDWIFMRSNPVDFVIDGYTIIRNKNIESIYREEEEEFTERVIRLKKEQLDLEEKVPLDNIQNIFQFLNDRFGIFQFYKRSEKAVYPGRLNHIDETEIAIDWIDTRAKWSRKRNYKLKKIRIIEFENDYLKSLKLAAHN